MNSSKNREFIAIAAMVTAVCVGAWYAFVQPKAKELARLQGVIEHAGSGSAQMSESTVEQCARQLADTRQFVQDVIRRNLTADDSSQLYAVIMNTAQKSAVEVQSLNPGSTPSLSSDSAVIVTPIEVSVIGEYSHVAEFFDSILSIQGFIRPASLTIAPYIANDQQLVSARFSGGVLHFNIPETLLKVGDTQDASQSIR
ncbi:MAG TPA: type 4a pilus biogenesis protein PilO [Phycisphaerales bacterium]|nr:type 4a pilus biogenesis protein PilO [Phycisphaerales bacterium]